MGLAKIVVPFVFVYGPEILLIGTTGEIVVAITSAFVGVYALSIATTGLSFSRRMAKATVPSVARTSYV